MPEISVVIPIYNKAEHLEECIQSLLDQSFKDIELICVEDKSTDGSAEILSQLEKRNPNVKAIYHDTNRGPHVSRYDGVMQASSEYLLFADADDTAEPQLCESAYREIRRKNADIVHYRVNVVAEDGVEPNEIEFVKEFTKPYEDNGDVFDSLVKERFKWHLWDKIYSTEVVKKAFAAIGADEILMGEDYLEMFFISFYSRSYSVYDRVLYNYHFGRGMHGYQTRSSIPILKKYCTAVRLYAKCMGLLKQANLLERYGDALRRNVTGRLQICLDIWKTLDTLKEREKGELLLRSAWGNTDLYPIACSFIDHEKECTSKYGLPWRMIAHNVPSIGDRQLLNESRSLGEDAVHIMTFAKDEFFPGSLVMMSSLVACMSADREYCLDCMYTSFNELNRYKLEQSIPEDSRLRLRFINCSGMLQSAGFGNVNPEDVCEILPFIANGPSRVMYVQWNMVMNSDPAVLFDMMDPMGKAMAAVRPNIGSNQKKHPEKSSATSSEYLDTSLFMINTENISASEKHELLNAVKEGSQFEESFSIVFRRYVQHMPEQWNVNLSDFEKDIQSPSVISSEFLNTVKDAKMITYSKKCEPWRHRKNAVFGRYWEIARNTPYYEQILVRGR